MTAINKLGALGWRVIYIPAEADGYPNSDGETVRDVIMEKETK